MLTALPAIGQATGALAVLVGLFLLLPFPIALVSAGVLVFFGSMLLEVAQTRPAQRLKPVEPTSKIGRAA
jgi:hypothetical protein